MLHLTSRILHALLLTIALARVASAQNGNQQQPVDLALSGNLLDVGNLVTVKVRTSRSGREWYYSGKNIPSTISTTEVSTSGCSYVLVHSNRAFKASNVRISFGGDNEDVSVETKGPFDLRQSIKPIDSMTPYVLVALLGNGCPEPACNDDEILVELEAVSFAPPFRLTSTVRGNDGEWKETDLGPALATTFPIDTNSYGWQHACLPRNGCYRFSRVDTKGQYDPRLFAVTIDGELLENYPDGYLQTRVFGEGSACACGNGETALDLYVHIESGSSSWQRWKGEVGSLEREPVVDLTWSLLDASGGQSAGRSGTVGYQEGFGFDNFHRLCVPRNSCHRLGLSVPPTFTFDRGAKEESFYLEGSYTAVVDGVLYGSHEFRFGAHDLPESYEILFPDTTYETVFADAALVGGGCSAAACAPNQSFLDVGYATIPEFPGGDDCVEFDGEQWKLDIDFHRESEESSIRSFPEWVTHKSYSRPLVYRSYDCLDHSDVACVLLHRDRIGRCRPTGVFDVRVDGTPIPQDDSTPHLWDGTFRLTGDDCEGFDDDATNATNDDEATASAGAAARGSVVGTMLGGMLAFLWSY